MLHILIRGKDGSQQFMHVLDISIGPQLVDVLLSPRADFARLASEWHYYPSYSHSRFTPQCTLVPSSSDGCFTTERCDATWKKHSRAVL